MQISLFNDWKSNLQTFGRGNKMTVTQVKAAEDIYQILDLMEGSSLQQYCTTFCSNPKNKELNSLIFYSWILLTIWWNNGNKEIREWTKNIYYETSRNKTWIKKK